MTRLLEVAYGALLEVVEDLDEDEGWAPTGCAGWAVQDLVQHLLADAQRALVALATPAEGPATTDAVDYWRAWRPGTGAAAADRRATRTVASVWSTVEPLARLHAETARAVLVAAGRAAPDDLVATQGQVLTVDDLLSTLVVEATVHHLDLVVALGRSGPPAATLGLVRRVAQGLLGEPWPKGLDDTQVALVATGRAAPPVALAHRVPLFG